MRRRGTAAGATPQAMSAAGESLAVKLLDGCGMIRRSEKRRLVVREAPGTRYLGLSIYERYFRIHCPSHNTGTFPNGFDSNSCFSVERNVITLVNPFRKACV
jgi:hypothetical protein